MGEAMRRMQAGGPQFNQLKPGQQIHIQIDPAKDKPESCECGCDLFEPAVQVYKISAVNPQNPTGRELMTQRAVLVCRKCGRVMG